MLRRKAWLQAIEFNETAQLSLNKIRICESHFAPEDYMTHGIVTGNRRRLNSWALPTKNLPGMNVCCYLFLLVIIQSRPINISY